MISTVIKHVETPGKILPSRTMGSSDGRLKPIRFSYPLRFSYILHPKNGESTTTIQTVFPGGKYEALAISPTWNGHRFLGWYTQANTPSSSITTAGTKKTASDSVVWDDADIYANWQLPASITFDATTNGGSMPAFSHDYYATLTYDTLPSVNSRQHYYYEGWFTSVDGGTKITESSIVPTSTTLYAQWTAATTVAFDATTNGGQMPNGWTAPDYYPGHEYGELPTPTHSTKSFVGWYDVNGDRVYKDDIVPVGGISLTAQYASQSYSVDLGNDWLDPQNASSETIGEGYWGWNDDTGEEYWVDGETTSYTPPSNPNSSLYDGVYESVQGQHYSDTMEYGGYTCWMKIHTIGYTEFTIYIRSSAESDYDFMIALSEDANPYETTVDYWGENRLLSEIYGYDWGQDNEFTVNYVKARTQGNQNSGQSITDYTEVTYYLDGGEHDIWIGFTKDGSVSDGDDRGYVIIPRT